MRVSKRYQRSLQYDGWLEYRTCVHRREARDKIPNKEIRKIRMEMAELENNFLEKIGEAPVNYNLEKKLTDSAPLSLAIPKLKSNFIPTTKTNASALSALKSPTNDGIIGNNLNSGNSNNTSPSSSKIVNKDDPEEEIVSVTNTDHDGEQDEGTFPPPSNIHPIKTEGKSPIAEKQDLMTTETSKATSIKEMPLKTIPSETSYVERKEKSEIDMEIEVSSYTEMNDVPLTSPPTSVNLDTKDKETQNVNNTTLDDKKKRKHEREGMAH
jgi:hypothetical protein